MPFWTRRPFISFWKLSLLLVPITIKAFQAGSPHQFAVLGQAAAQDNLTCVVDRLTDANPSGGGEGSDTIGDLRYAILNARSGDMITFEVTGTIRLSSALPTLAHDIIIHRLATEGVTIFGSGSGGVFSIDNATRVDISNLTITGGVGNGGGIFNSGVLTLHNITVSGN